MGKQIFQKKLFLVAALVIVASITIFSSLAVSRMTFYSFSITLPDEVVARAGDEVTVEGEILVTGMYWLHNFDITLEGLNYEYTVNPGHWQDVRILREWNPTDGVYRVPETFTVDIKVPSDASGLNIITVTGQEHHSFREVSNSTFFVLKIEGEAPVEEPERIINVTDILTPETVEEGKPFDITFRAVNLGAEKKAVAVSILAPEDWEVKTGTIYLDVDAGDSKIGTFTLTPSASAGTVSMFLEYPYKQEIINFTREGPYLQPVTTTTTTTIVEKPFIVELYEGFVNSVSNAWTGMVSFVTGGEAPDVSLTPFTLGIIAVLVVIILWLTWGIVKDMRSDGGKKTEDLKKQIIGNELGTTTAENSDVLKGIDKL